MYLILSNSVVHVYSTTRLPNWFYCLDSSLGIQGHSINSEPAIVIARSIFSAPLVLHVSSCISTTAHAMCAVWNVLFKFQFLNTINPIRLPVMLFIWKNCHSLSWLATCGPLLRYGLFAFSVHPLTDSLPIKELLLPEWNCPVSGVQRGYDQWPDISFSNFFFLSASFCLTLSFFRLLIGFY